MEIKEKLRNARKAANLTQKQLADKLGMDKRNYQKYESGVCVPKLDKLLKIADACKVSLDYFIKD